MPAFSQNGGSVARNNSTHAHFYSKEEHVGKKQWERLANHWAILRCEARVMRMQQVKIAQALRCKFGYADGENIAVYRLSRFGMSASRALGPVMPTFSCMRKVHVFFNCWMAQDAVQSE